MWPKKAIDWIENGTAFVSVPFTWELPQAYSRCIFLREQGYKVRAGGPAVGLMPDYLASVARIGGQVDALRHHHPDATFTSRGCIRRCEFCAVPQIEGDLVELAEWEVRPIVCDNNLLACSDTHFDKVIDSLKPLVDVDFNQGLDARLLTEYHATRLAELDLKVVRLAWDHTGSERWVMKALEMLRGVGIGKMRIRVYVLLNHKDTPGDALYRLQTLKDWGVRPFPMRYRPLDALEKNAYISPHWTKEQIYQVMEYWTQLRRFEHIPFEEFDAHSRHLHREKGQERLF